MIVAKISQAGELSALSNRCPQWRHFFAASRMLSAQSGQRFVGSLVAASSIVMGRGLGSLTTSAAISPNTPKIAPMKNQPIGFRFLPDAMKADKSPQASHMRTKIKRTSPSGVITLRKRLSLGDCPRPVKPVMRAGAW